MTTEFCMSIGDVTIAVMDTSARMLDGLMDRYCEYRSRRAPALHVEFISAARDQACGRLGIPCGSLVQFETGEDRGLRFPHGQPRPRVEEWLRERSAQQGVHDEVRPRILSLEGRILIERVDFAGVFDRSAKRARCVCSHGSEFLAVESFLRVCFSMLAVQRGGLLLHAAGIVKDEQAYVFAGPSGTGKSTIAGLSADRGRILSDEMIYVQGVERGGYIFGTPFHGTNSEQPFAPGAPLRVVLFPVKDTTTGVESLRPPDALRRLLAATFSFDASTDGHQRLLDLAAALVQKTSMLQLRFRKDASLWDAIDSSDDT